MNTSKQSYAYSLLKRTFLLFVLIVQTPQYLAGLKAQNPINDSEKIKQLLASADEKKFSDTAAAFQLAKQALVLAQQNKNSICIFQSNSCIATIYDEHGQDAQANSYLTANLSVENSLPDTLKKTLYGDLGLSCIYMGKMDNAYTYFMKLNQLGITSKNKSIQALANKRLAMFYREVNDFEQSSQFFIKSIALAVELDDVNEICESYRFLTALYLKAKNYNLALESAEKSMTYINKIDSKNAPKYRIYITYGNTLKDCKQYEKAVAAYEKAEVLCNEVGDKTSLSRVYIGLTTTYTKMNNLAKAEYYSNLCASLSSVMTIFDVMYHKNSAGNLYLKKGDYAKSIEHFNISITLTEKYKNKVLLENNYAKISEAYEKNKEKNLSLIFLKKSVMLQDSLFSEENTKRIADAQFKYNLVKSEEQLKTMQQRQIYSIAIGLLIALALLVAFLMYFSRIKNEKNIILLEKNQEIKDKNRQLEESNEILRQFAFASAHDLKEPLRSISSFVSLIQRRYTKELPPEATEYIGFVTTGVRRMDSLLGALLEFSTVLNDDNIVSKKNDIPTLLPTIFKRLDSLIQEKKAVIRYPSLFPQIFMSETHLKQILSNLVNNALKYSKEEAKIEIGYEAKNDELIVFIKDEGIGMEKSYSDKIFKLFQRLDKTTHKESVGIGLTICKNIVDKYAGRLWFESVVNEGTTFFIAFPKSMISDMPSFDVPPQYLEVKGAILEAHLSV
jgi:signal transduction histidine kinase